MDAHPTHSTWMMSGRDGPSHARTLASSGDICKMNSISGNCHEVSCSGANSTNALPRLPSNMLMSDSSPKPPIGSMHMHAHEQIEGAIRLLQMQHEAVVSMLRQNQNLSQSQMGSQCQMVSQAQMASQTQLANQSRMANQSHMSGQTQIVSQTQIANFGPTNSSHLRNQSSFSNLNEEVRRRFPMTNSNWHQSSSIHV